MNRKKFIRELSAAGCTLKRHGKKHDVYVNPNNGRTAPIPRHTEVKDTLCDAIRRQLRV